MSKRKMTKEAKRLAEIAAIRDDLYLLAVGALGGPNVEDDPDNGAFLWSTLGSKDFSRYLSAVKRLWQIGLEFIQDEQPCVRCRFMLEPYNLHRWESLDSGAEFLHDNGARAGGGWVE